LLVQESIWNAVERIELEGDFRGMKTTERTGAGTSQMVARRRKSDTHPPGQNVLSAKSDFRTKEVLEDLIGEKK